MKNKTILSLILVIISIGLAVSGYIILPEQVVIQFSIGTSGNSTAPKLLAILIPTAIGVGGAVASLFSGDGEKSYGKSLLVSVVGIILCIFMIAVNSFLQ